MRYNTGNPVEPNGSSDPRDLFDNSANLDLLVNGPAPSYPDRTGTPRKSWAGMEEDFQQFLLNSGYQDIGDYAAGLTVTARNQIFIRAGEYYRAAAATALPYTMTGNWTTDGPKFVSLGDAVLRQDLAGASGATHVGRGGSDVDADLTDLEGRAASLEATDVAIQGQVTDIDDRVKSLSAQETKSFNSVNGAIVTGGFAPVRCINILGDSISYGANAQNIQRDSYVGILRKMLNIEFGTQNMGWLSVIASTSNAEGTYQEYHTQTSQTGTWSSIVDAAAAHIPSGYAIQSTVVGSTLVYRVPVSQRYLRVWYDGTVTGSIEILINGVVVQTITTTGAGTGYERGGALELANLAAAKNGLCTFTLRCASGTVRITGFEFTNDTTGEYRLNNFSRDGRAGRYVSQDVINKACAGTYALIWALGTNDVPGGATAITEYTQRIDWLIAAAATNKTRVILLDLMYDQAPTHGLREQLRRANKAIPGSVLIEAAKIWAVDGVELNTAERTARGLSSGVHPEENGHRLIAEVIAQRMGLSVTSKRAATRCDPMWRAFDLSAGTALNQSNLPGQFVGWRIGERSIEVVGTLASVPSGTVTLGTIPSNEMPSNAMNAVSFKSVPDGSGNTGQLSLSASGVLTYSVVGTAPLFVTFYASIPFNDTTAWY